MKKSNSKESEYLEFYDIPNFDGLYQINKIGPVKSLSRSFLKNGIYPSLMIKIRERYSKGGITYFQLANEYNVSFSLIGQIVRGRIWTDLL